MTPEVNYAAVGSGVTLENLDTFPSDAYLTSDDNVQTDPSWLVSTYGKPNGSGYSAAPATIIVVDKGDIIDVFYFYFYSYNQGLTYVYVFFMPLSTKFIAFNFELKFAWFRPNFPEEIAKLSTTINLYFDRHFAFVFKHDYV